MVSLEKNRKPFRIMMCAGSDFQESSIGEFKIDIPIHDSLIEALHFPMCSLKKCAE